VREFVASRRARITPEQAGLPNFGGTCRVAGLRRAEVVARALQLNDAERSHLYDLARAANRSPRARRRPTRPTRRAKPAGRHDQRPRVRAQRPAIAASRSGELT